MIKKYRWLIPCLCWIACAAQTPESAYRRYTAADGLPSSEVYHCIQDAEGYLWFATDRGIARFDGYDFEVINTENGLIDNVVFELFEDYRGRIWILPMNGRLSYYHKGVVTEYPHNDLLTENLVIKYGDSFHVDSLDNVYFGSNHNGMIVIDAQGTKRVLEVEQSLEGNGRNVHFLDIDGRLLGAGYSKTSRDIQGELSLGSNHFYRNRLLFNVRRSKRAKAIDFDGRMVVNGFSDFFVLNENYRIIDSVSYENAVVYFDRVEDLLIAGVFGQGLYVYQWIDRALKLKHHLLSDYTCSSFLKDREGGYWITTTQKGVFYAPSLEIASYNQTNGLLHDYIYKLEAYDGRLLIAYPDTVQVFDGVFRSFETAENASTTKRQLHDSLRYNRQGCFINYNDSRIFNLCEDRPHFTSEREESTLAIAHGDQLYLVNAKFVNRYAADTIEILALGSEFPPIEDLEVIGEEDFWLATTTGLYRYTEGNIRALATLDSVLSLRIIALAQTENYGLLAATRGGGLVMLNDDRLQIVNTENGLTTNDITSMHVDGEENIWLATNQGLHRITAHDFTQIDYFSTYEGLISNEITDVRRIGDKVYVGTKKGLSVIDLSTFRRYPADIELQLNSVLLDGYRVADTLLRVNQGQHVVEMTLLGKNYRAGGRLEYGYRVGNDPQGKWATTEHRQLTLELPTAPGTYQVEVRARALPNGEWSAEQQMLEIAVVLPFYKTAWFLFVVVGGVLLLVYLSIRTNLLAYPKHLLHAVLNLLLSKLGRKSFLVIKVDKADIRIAETDILYIQACKDYVEINTEQERYLYRSTLKDMEKQLGAWNFLRVHRSYIVSVNKIDRVSRDKIRLKEHEIPIGKTYRAALKPLQDQFSALNS